MSFVDECRKMNICKHGSDHVGALNDHPVKFSLLNPIQEGRFLAVYVVKPSEMKMWWLEPPLEREVRINAYQLETV
jgi:hypothetical protein